MTFENGHRRIGNYVCFVLGGVVGKSGEILGLKDRLKARPFCNGEILKKGEK